MYIRCAECEQATWVEPRETGLPATLGCGSCGQLYATPEDASFGADPRERYESALRFAEENRLDLASAYSVLLGIFDLRRARQAQKRHAERRKQRREAATASPAPTPAVEPAPALHVRPGAAGLEATRDPALRDALAGGRATAQRNLERDDRRPRTASRTERRDPAAAAPGQRRLALLLAAVVAVVVILYGMRIWERQLDESRAAAALTQRAADLPDRGPRTGRAPAADAAVRILARNAIDRDAEGRVTRVSGPDPISVLEAFCLADPTGRLRAIELTAALPPSSGARLGILRDAGDPTSTYALPIRRDGRSRRWIAGDGRAPIVPGPAPDLPADYARFPLAAR